VGLRRHMGGRLGGGEGAGVGLQRGLYSVEWCSQLWRLWYGAVSCDGCGVVEPH
jgi:hypothetical protein